MCQFLAIRKKCGTNDPVPDLVWVADHDEVTAIPAATTDVGTGVFNTIITDVTLAAGKFWKALEFRRRSPDFTIEDQGEQDANQYCIDKLIAFYPESDPEAMYKIGLAKGWEGFMIFQNGNGDKVFWGTLANRVELIKANFTASKGGWDLEFQRMRPANELPPPFYTGAVVTS